MAAQSVDVAVVGGGIVGLAFAWTAARDGRSVVVFERDPQARGASIRNFGMIWPIGQAAGRAHRLALRGRKLWREAARQSGFWLNECGSILLAHRDDELRVLDEFARLASSNGYECRRLQPDEVLDLAPAVNPNALRGGLWSPTEMCVDPREVLGRLSRWLTETFDVVMQFGTPVVRIDDRTLETSRGTRWEAERIVVASGSDLRTLFPEILERSSLVLCKLQMLRTRPQPDGWRAGPLLASGLSLRHYESFAVCPSLAALRQRVTERTPELDQWGIHVLAAQNARGEVLLGDSHEYGEVVDPFLRRDVERLILTSLRTVIQLPDWEIAERWYGVYARHPTAMCLEVDARHGVKIVTGLGGAGMTLSFGLAEDVWRTWT
ncbi:MAG: TIGR03364 family FAD-dependent oxidoreductase [Phycisphaeraceae bacterium]|nr:TIGR03364 family FAD-dependent oxidoreductase [Phycisphaeraceae bacterium]